MSTANLQAWADTLLPVAEAAGRKILEIQRGAFTVTAKADASPVTIARDQAAEAIMLAGAQNILSRVSRSWRRSASPQKACRPLRGDGFWLVDPLDGTKEFVKGGDDFTVNIGLIQNGIPVLGIVHAPARGDSFIGVVSQRRARPIKLTARHPDRRSACGPARRGWSSPAANPTKFPNS